MKKFAGVAQQIERREVSLPEVAGSNPASRSSHDPLGPLKRALAAGVTIDPAARKLGRDDGLAGYFRLSEDDILDSALSRAPAIDVLAYAAGFLEGDIARRRKQGN